MGIHGLMSYVGENNHFFDNIKLQNTRIVVDGNNLFHRLYFDSRLDLKYGGEYDLFTDIICKFFEALALCNISPYVLFDGGCDCTDKKFETIKQRARDKILKAHSISRGGGGMVLPLLVPGVFKQVLAQLQVPYVQCHSEADRDIVALANQWNCPVLTLDSDFCIFDLKAGYCPLNYFKWEDVTSLKDHSESYISARCFSIEKFCNHFNHMNKALLPLFAVLNGNDYINLPFLENFSTRIHFHTRTSSAGRKNERIQGLLNWLSGFSEPKEAIENILKSLKQREREKVQELLCFHMDEYIQSDVDLAKYFQNKDIKPNAPTMLASKAPEWMLAALLKGELAPFLSDCLTLRRTFLQPQVENMRRTSSHKCSLSIRQVIYGLLSTDETFLDSTLGQSAKIPGEASLKAEEYSKVHYVQEYDRHDQTLKKTNIQAVLKRFNSNEIHRLQRLPEISILDRTCFLLETLKVKTDVQALPANLHLTVYITCYWVAHAEPKVTPHHLQALLLCIVTGELHKLINKPGNSNPMEKDIGMVYDRLSQLRQREQQMGNLDIDVAHVFCQWQSCLLMGIYLNQLLCCPLPTPDITRLYSGTLVHRFYQELKSMAATEDLLEGCLAAGEIYSKLLNAVTATVPADFFKTGKKSKSHRRLKKKPN
ncbi:protein asteroid homolog 1 [Pristis pectinata]|uniref:protein asteroid homolog 1 n=1 Tax=Pristis pectinata TaxID=685728 RepID=UPI00223DD850|nr:protein asteroid homolog 1 [Pristis pectinata]